MQFIKKNAKLKSLTIDQLTFCRNSLKHIKDSYMAKHLFQQTFCKASVQFSQGYNTQHCLLVMIEKIEEARDKNKAWTAVITDLSKVFDCLKHYLLIAKLIVKYAYLNDRVQAREVGFYYSEILDIIFGVPQRSILGRLLLNVNIIGFFYDRTLQIKFFKLCR